MIAVFLAAILVSNLNGFGQTEVVFTYDITVRNNAIVLSAETVRINSRNVSAVCIVEIMELCLCICVQTLDTFIIRREDNYVDLVSIRLVHIKILTTVFVCYALASELGFGKTELTINIGIGGSKQIVNRVVINRFSKHIEYLRRELKLLNHIRKLVISSCCLQAFSMVVDHTNNISDNFLGCRFAKLGLSEQTSHLIKRCKIVGNSYTSDIISQKTVIVDKLHYCFTVKGIYKFFNLHSRRLFGSRRSLICINGSRWCVLRTCMYRSCCGCIHNRCRRCDCGSNTHR